MQRFSRTPPLASTEGTNDTNVRESRSDLLGSTHQAPSKVILAVSPFENSMGSLPAASRKYRAFAAEAASSFPAFGIIIGSFKVTNAPATELGMRLIRHYLKECGLGRDSLLHRR